MQILDIKRSNKVSLNKKLDKSIFDYSLNAFFMTLYQETQIVMYYKINHFAAILNKKKFLP